MNKLLSIFILFFYSTLLFSQKVTLSPLSFNKEFELKKAPTNNVLKDYTEFSSSPFKKIPEGFTLSDASVFYKFDTLNCSLFIKKREDVDSLYYYRDCEDGRWCWEQYAYSNYKNEAYIKYRNEWFSRRKGCCEFESDLDTTALFFKNEFVNNSDFLILDQNLSYSIIKNNYVSNIEYDNFINYCIDSIQREILANDVTPQDTSFKINFKHPYGRLNYNRKYDADKYLPSLSQVYYPDHEKLNWKKSRDHRKVNYSYYDISYRIFFEGENCSKCGSLISNPGEFECECQFGLKGCSQMKINGNYSDYFKEIIYHNTTNKINNKPRYYYKQVRRQYNMIVPDSLSWLFTKDQEKLNYKIWVSQNYSVDKKHQNMPVQGVNYWQAKAFLNWKTFYHNRQLIREKLPYRVLYTFPLPEEVTEVNKFKVITPNIEFEKFVITNSDYEKFVCYVVDSAITLMKYYEHYSYGRIDIDRKIEKATRIPTYDDNGDLRDFSDWNNNKKAYQNYFLKTTEELKRDTLFYTFQDLLIPEREIEYWNYSGFDTREIWYWYNWVYYNKDSLYHMRDLNLSHWDEFDHVLDFEDRSQFLIKDKILIYPGYNVKEISLSDSKDNAYKQMKFYKYCDSVGIKRFIPDSLNFNSPDNFGLQHWERDSLYTFKHKLYDFKSAPNTPITAITYEQAKAYYHWKNEVPYIPTKEEWNLIKQGINPYEEKELEVPGPFFRYVIRVYPVREK